MSFTKRIKPYVVEQLAEGQQLLSENKPGEAFACLENAHVLGQRSTRWHTASHVAMLKWALAQRDFKEFFGQLLRIVGALTKTPLGWVPIGNTGGANVSPFRPMPLKEPHRRILDKASGSPT